MKTVFAFFLAFGMAAATAARLSAAEPEAVPDGARALLAAYPEQLAIYRDGNIIWRDGTAMPYDDGRANKTAAELFENASLRDQLSLKYPAGRDYSKPPPRDFDPGRFRCEPFFLKMYGSSVGEVEKNLVSITWMPQTAPQKLRVTRINHVNEHLAAVSAELEAKLPPSLKAYATKSEGTYYWRKIAKSDRLSAHSFAIAIDINVSYSDYWQWSHPDAAGHAAYRNRMPLEIVEIFERHGFIWGGKWEHFDTMHFEYRPELLPPDTTDGPVLSDASAVPVVPAPSASPGLPAAMAEGNFGR